MTHEAKMLISDILIDALWHCWYTTGPYDILGKVLHSYFVEWDWVKEETK